MTPARTASSPWLGLLLLAIGGGIMAVGGGLFPSALKGANAPLWVILAAGALFALAGVAFFVPRDAPKAVTGLLPCLMWTLFAAIPAWIAFGEGPRQFSISVSGFGLGLWWREANLGRIAFGAVAVLMAALSAVVWLAYWRALSGRGRAIAPFVAAVLAWLFFVEIPAEPRWEGLADDHERLARYGELSEREGWLRHARRGRPTDWAFPPWRNLDSWSKAARSRLAAARVVPSGAEVQSIPRGRAPTVDGAVVDGEWQGALVLGLGSGDGRGIVRLLSDGRRLYLAAEAPADTTPAGYDQFRFWFHLQLSPAMPYERAFVDGSGGVNVMRTSVFPWGDNPSHERTDWHTHRQAIGASAVHGFRRFVLALDLEEAGLHVGVPFPAYFEIEGDPVLDAAGKFVARTTVGRLGSLEAPVWLRIAP
jgi:hypothetical protein